MKVALLTDSDVFAGTERHMLDLAAALRVLGVTPTLVCPSGGALAKRGRIEEIPVLPLEKRTFVDLKASKQLTLLWSQKGYDVLHAHNGRMALHAALARTATKRGSLVSTQHFLAPARAERRGLTRTVGQLLHGFINRLTTHQIAISQAVGDAMLARHEVSSTKLRVVPNGIRDPRLLPLTSREVVRHCFNVPPSAQLIVCLARLEPEKGLDTLISAMQIVARRLSSVCCLIAGRGRLEGNLQAQITAAPTTDTVRLVGFVDDSLSLLGAADLCVLPSVAEPFGLTLVEAMSLGVPVVATRAGGPPEIVQDTVSGLLVSPQNPTELATAILSILDNPGIASKMGASARTDFLARFTAERMARQTLAVYEEAIE